MLTSAFSPYSSPALAGSGSPEQLSPLTGYFDILPTQPPSLYINTNIPQRPILERSIFSSSSGELNSPYQQDTEKIIDRPSNGWRDATKLRQDCLSQWESTKLKLHKTSPRPSTGSKVITNHQLRPTAKLTESGPPIVSSSSSSDFSSTTITRRSSDTRPSLTPLQSHWPFNRSGCGPHSRSPSSGQRYSSNMVFKSSGLRAYSNRNENMNLGCYSSNLVAEQV